MSLRVAIRAASAVLLAASAGWATTYTGSLVYQPPPDASDQLIVGGTSGGWPVNNMTVAWTVDDADISNPGFPWKYTYHIQVTTPQFGFSHAIVETSPDALLADFSAFSGAAVASFGVQTVQSGNPGLPENFYGLRFNPLASGLTDWTFSFFSTRAPVWGDAYIKDGGNPVNYAYNKGFGSPDADPTAPPADGAVNNHILRPDSVTFIPEPVAAVFFGTGVAAVGGLVARRRLQRAAKA